MHDDATEDDDRWWAGSQDPRSQQRAVYFALSINVCVALILVAGCRVERCTLHGPRKTHHVSTAYNYNTLPGSPLILDSRLSLSKPKAEFCEFRQATSDRWR
jgi:hypothetical protein